MNFTLTIGDWSTQQAAAKDIRYDVFVVEQNVPIELEWDDADPVSLHAIVCDEAGRPVGTGRLLPDGYIGRMAVQASARGEGVGAAILTALMHEAEDRGESAVRLHAQLHAEAFYARFGFVRDGAQFMEAGIPHVLMWRSLRRTSRR
ncbi:GNAT family N-acetyltransferase [soil metagenome]